MDTTYENINGEVYKREKVSTSYVEDKIATRNSLQEKIDHLTMQKSDYIEITDKTIKEVGEEVAALDAEIRSLADVGNEKAQDFVTEVAETVSVKL